MNSAVSSMPRKLMSVVEDVDTTPEEAARHVSLKIAGNESVKLERLI